MAGKYFHVMAANQNTQVHLHNSISVYMENLNPTEVAIERTHLQAVETGWHFSKSQACVDQ